MPARRSDLITYVVQDNHWTEEEAAAAVDSVLRGIEYLAVSEERLILKGFGTFSMRVRKAYATTSGLTGERILVPSTARLGLKGSPLVSKGDQL